MKQFKRSVLLAILTLSLIPMTVQATSLTKNQFNGDLSAEAVFEIVGGNFQVTLTNNSTYDVLVPSDILTAVFFFMDESIVLTAETAWLGLSMVVNGEGDTPPEDGQVGGEWAYEEVSVSDVLGHPGANRGISTAGFDIFGIPNFDGDNLNKNEQVNGMDYGITSTGDDITTGNKPVTGKNAFIQDSVVFTLSGLPLDSKGVTEFDPFEDIDNVTFQWGTDLEAVPKPTTFLLLGAGLVGFASG